jgi:hypothetical protein
MWTKCHLPIQNSTYIYIKHKHTYAHIMYDIYSHNTILRHRLFTGNCGGKSKVAVKSKYGIIGNFSSRTSMGAKWDCQSIGRLYIGFECRPINKNNIQMFLHMDEQSIVSWRLGLEHYDKEISDKQACTALWLHSCKLIYQRNVAYTLAMKYLSPSYRQQNSCFVCDMVAFPVNIKQHVVAQLLRRNKIRVKKLKVTHQTEKG